MKIRQGFVSNSSSSSFIVIQEGKLEKVYLDNDKVLRLGDKGNLEFGWEQTTYDYVYDKINFAWIQAQYQEKPKGKHKGTWLWMLEKVLKEYTGAKRIEWEMKGDYWYIDHQSSASEGQNIEMFESEEKLKTFLFSKNSYIEGDNDNH